MHVQDSSSRAVARIVLAFGVAVLVALGVGIAAARTADAAVYLYCVTGSPASRVVLNPDSYCNGSDVGSNLRWADGDSTANGWVHVKMFFTNGSETNYAEGQNSVLQCLAASSYPNGSGHGRIRNPGSRNAAAHAYQGYEGTDTTC